MTAANTYGLPSVFNAQTIYDKVATHLLTQGKPAVAPVPDQNGKPSGMTSCAYRGTGGTACAVGCLISDSDYDPSMEGMGVDDVISRFVRPGIGMLEPFERLLVTLQRIHDDHNNANTGRTLFYQGELIEDLDKAAVRHRLSAAVLDSFRPAASTTQ